LRDCFGEKRMALDLPATEPAPGWAPDLPSLALLGDLAEVAWFVVDARRNVVALGPLTERLTGFYADEVLGRPCIHLSRCEACLRGCGVFERGRVRDQRLTLYRADGRPLDVAKSAVALRDLHGAPCGALEILRPLRLGDPAVEPCDEPNGEQNLRERIARALHETRYNRTRAAVQLGMSRTTLWRKMRDFDL
jgi:PAS domain-containing protein